MVGFGFTPDWMTKWSELFEPIAWRSNVKLNQMPLFSTLK